MDSSRELTVKIKGDTRDVESALGKLSGKAESTGLSFSKLVGAISLGNIVSHAATKAFDDLGEFLKDSFKEAADAQDTMAQLNAVIKSTGGAAGVTADEVVNLANKLALQTTYSDDAVKGVENLMLTFTNINSRIFPQTTSTILDMATAMHEDLQSATIQVGKALQDPVLGMTALRRVGVDFSEDQKKVVQGLVDTGQSAKAQQLILAELNKEFGGSAAAATTTFAGKMALTANAIKQVKESIGNAILTAIAPLQDRLIKFVSSDKFQKWVTDLTKWMADNLPNAINWIIKVGLPDLEKVIKTAGDTIKFFTNIWKALNDAISNVFVWIYKAGVAIENFGYKVENIFENIKSAIVSAVKGFGSLLYDAGKNLINGLINGIKDMIGAVGNTINNIGAAARDKMKSILGIHSPSAVFHDIGMNMGRGLINGLTSTMGDVQAAVSGIASPSIQVGQQSASQTVVQASPTTSSPSSVSITLAPQIGVYAGMPQERREIAVLLWNDLVKEARAVGVSLPHINLPGVQA